MKIQEEKLARVAANEGMNIIAVTSGKGGVGKTNIAVNLAVSLAQQGRKVVLFDGDLGLANVDVALGLRPSYDIRHVVSGEKKLQEILLEGPRGIRIVPATSGVAKLNQLDAQQRANIVNAFSELGDGVDTLIVDTGAGIHANVQTFCSACQSVVVVICDEPSSITDAYALIKVLNKENGIKEFQLLANMVDGEEQGRALYRKISRVASRFLDVSLGYLGAIPRDNYLCKAVQQQSAVVDLYPRSSSAKAIQQLAESVASRSASTSSNGMGRLGFFVERLIRNHTNQIGAIS
ncbi:MAG: MinD/ParA family protein [Halioglobus sp.]